jgi:hypothetical protein
LVFKFAKGDGLIKRKRNKLAVPVYLVKVTLNAIIPIRALAIIVNGGIQNWIRKNVIKT